MKTPPNQPKTLLLALLTAGNLTLIAEAAPVPEDPRTAIMLTPGERALVLAEMRAFLQSVQVITQSLFADNLPSAAAAARKVGLAHTGEVPDTLKAKLPMDFRKLGSATHRAFDELALDAEQLGDPNHALGQLASLLSNCVACHATYRIEAAQ